MGWLAPDRGRHGNEQVSNRSSPPKGNTYRPDDGHRHNDTHNDPLKPASPSTPATLRTLYNRAHHIVENGTYSASPSKLPSTLPQNPITTTSLPYPTHYSKSSLPSHSLLTTPPSTFSSIIHTHTHKPILSALTLPSPHHPRFIKGVMVVEERSTKKSWICVLPRLEEWHYAVEFLHYENELDPQKRQHLISSLQTLHSQTQTHAPDAGVTEAEMSGLRDPPHPNPTKPIPASSSSSVSTTSTHTPVLRTPCPNARSSQYALAGLTPSSSSSSVASDLTATPVIPNGNNNSGKRYTSTHPHTTTATPYPTRMDQPLTNTTNNNNLPFHPLPLPLNRTLNKNLNLNFNNPPQPPKHPLPPPQLTSHPTYPSAPPSA
ncbi:hypothetical protein PILCRDRAFT_11329 [Piloderma croceum F 1598]|uniref:Uncharacterized protein n=1 Tax=Piloderma croceum (strain F 1598) TaxID=765440 RepID=A0A0C3BM05_PILCF|nr:hypothetical protein PILCRDRAFT_11329 [Piloderma croceum F 1598]